MAGEGKPGKGRDPARDQRTHTSETDEIDVMNIKKGRVGFSAFDGSCNRLRMQNSEFVEPITTELCLRGQDEINRGLL